MGTLQFKQLPPRLQTCEAYHLGMSRLRREKPGPESTDRSARSDVFLPEEPDEVEDDEEDEGNVTDNEGDDDEEDDGGYSLRVCRLCQW